MNLFDEAAASTRLDGDTIDVGPVTVGEAVAADMACCATWDGNALLAETPLVHARADGFPVTPGHALIIPRRHVESYVDLTIPELLDVHALIAHVCGSSDADSFTIGVNDGPDAGRTVDHLHIHVIPRRPGDVPDPRGGVRRVVIPDACADPWINGRP